MHVERTFTVARPVEEVFDRLSDFTRTNEWDPATIDTERTSGDGGVGTTYSSLTELLGRKVELVFETVELERPTTLVFRGNEKDTWLTHTLALSADAGGAGTSVRHRTDYVLPTASAIRTAMFGRRRLEALADETVTLMRETLEAD